MKSALAIVLGVSVLALVLVVTGGIDRRHRHGRQDHGRRRHGHRRQRRQRWLRRRCHGPDRRRGAHPGRRLGRRGEQQPRCSRRDLRVRRRHLEDGYDRGVRRPKRLHQRHGSRGEGSVYDQGARHRLLWHVLGRGHRPQPEPAERPEHGHGCRDGAAVRRFGAQGLRFTLDGAVVPTTLRFKVEDNSTPVKEYCTSKTVGAGVNTILFSI